MTKDRYVAYVGTYTHGKSEGIYIFDIDTDTWTLKERKVIPVENPSDVLVSNNGQFLYAVTDRGVNAYQILEDGDLEFLNSQWTGGMRGCYLETDQEDRFLFVAGYHDARVSVMPLGEDGYLGEVADGVFHEGIGLNITDRSAMPHVTCVKMTQDDKGLFAVDSGLDQVKVYDVDGKTGKLRLRDIIRCELDSGPRMLRMYRQGEYIYILGGMSNRICVYHAVPDSVQSGAVDYECIQKISTVSEGKDLRAAASGIEFSPDGRYLFVSNAGVNTIAVFSVDPKTGLLEQICSGYCGGDYPKSLAVLPDNEHFVVLSHNTNEMMVYRMNYEEGYFLMSSKPVSIGQPNSIFIHKIL